MSKVNFSLQSSEIIIILFKHMDGRYYMSKVNFSLQSSEIIIILFKHMDREV